MFAYVCKVRKKKYIRNTEVKMNTYARVNEKKRIRMQDNENKDSFKMNTYANLK